MTPSLRAFASTLVEILFLSFVAAPCGALAGSVSQLGLAGWPTQSVAPVSGDEKVSDNVRLLHLSAEAAPMPRQARHRVFHRTLLGAATAYVAILAVALLILVCARRLSNLSVGVGRVRSLAGAEGHELAGACGGSADGGEEEENHEGDDSSPEVIIEQARQNIESFKDAVKRLKQLKTGAPARAVRAAMSLYILLACEIGLLGAFVEKEIRSLKSQWHEVLQDAIDSSSVLETGRQHASSVYGEPELHTMNGDLVAFISTVKSAKKKRMANMGMDRWAVLRRVVKVQAVTASIALKYLSIIHPESGATHSPRKQALRLLAALADARRIMLLAEPVFAAYFKGFSSAGLAKQRFGHSCGPTAQAANPPLNPEAQIDYLREHFPEDLSTQPSGAVAEPTSSPPGAAPSSEPIGPATHPQGSPVQPAVPPLQTSAPPSASGPGSHGPHSFAQLGARPKTSSQGTASTGQKGGLMPSKHGSPGDPKAAGHSLSSPLGKEGKQPQGKAPGSRHSDIIPEAWNVGPRLRQRKLLEAIKRAQTDAASSSKGKTLPAPRPEADGGAADKPQVAPADELAQGLAALSVWKEEALTADDGGAAGEEIEPLDGSAVHLSQTMQVVLPTQGQHSSSSFPWSAPGTQVSQYMPGVGSSLSPLVGPFFGVPQGMPRSRLPSPRPPLPPGFWGPSRPSGPAPHSVQRPPGPPGMSTGVLAMSPSLRPPPPPGFAGPQQPGGFVRHMLQRPSGPSGPLTSTSGGLTYGPLPGPIQRPFPRAPRPPFPSMPSPSGLTPPSPSQPSGGVPFHAAPAVPSMRGPPHVSPSVPSVPSPFSLFGAPSIWSPFFPSAPRHSFSGTQPPPPSPPSLMGPSPSELSTPAVSWHPPTGPSPDQGEPKSPMLGAFYGTPMGEPKPSGTSVTTAPPPS
ncbi:hypothetical protein Emed_003442 [Eimeria media]